MMVCFYRKEYMDNNWLPIINFKTIVQYAFLCLESYQKYIRNVPFSSMKNSFVRSQTNPHFSTYTN